METRKAGNLGRRLGPGGLGSATKARPPAPGAATAAAGEAADDDEEDEEEEGEEAAADKRPPPRRSHCDENESHRPRMPGARAVPAAPPRLRPVRTPLCLAGGGALSALRLPAAGGSCLREATGCGLGCGLGCALALEFLRAGSWAFRPAAAASLSRRDGARTPALAETAAAGSFLGRFSLRPSSGTESGSGCCCDRRCGCCRLLWAPRCSLITTADRRGRRRPAGSGAARVRPPTPSPGNPLDTTVTTNEPTPCRARTGQDRHDQGTRWLLDRGPSGGAGASSEEGSSSSESPQQPPHMHAHIHTHARAQATGPSMDGFHQHQHTRCLSTVFCVVFRATAATAGASCC